MKRCIRCKQELPLEAFHRWGRGDGRQPWCRPCRKEYDAAYHQRVKDRRREHKRRKYAEKLAWYWALKERLPCTGCGEHVHHAAMTFDHLPGKKKLDDVGSTVRRAGPRTLLAEIAKCEPVCANCHAVRTFTRGRGVAQPG